ncbi:methyltransferase domain-containing protein [Nostoc sp.]|uniref:methyltransferase domain-containing protein n=1 Tax=Nostoc sp. TaxID=1180 RepID=UPI002FFC051E
MNTEQLKLIVQKILPSPTHHWLKSQYNKVRLGTLQSLKPINSGWGFEQGKPIDRYYIENFLGRHSNDIYGHVLEIGDNYYTQQFGGDRVTKSDVLHVQDNPNATIIADLTDAEHIPSNTFDSFVLVQTLQLIYEVRLALKTTYRIMKPGGVVLATFPGITPLKDEEWNNCWCWNFTALSAQRLFEEVFPKENIQVETHGNALAATAFLQGLVVQDIPKGKLDYHDRSYEVTITVRAVKPEVME